MNNLNELYEAILAGKLEQAVSVTREAVAGGVAPQEIINEYMIKAMEAIGARFESGQVFVPNLLMSARAMRGALDILKPLMQGKIDSYIGRIVIGTVKGDLHDIGKNLVASMFEGCGFEVINLGVDVSSDKFISAALENKADIICMSALLTTTMNYMDLVNLHVSCAIRNCEYFECYVPEDNYQLPMKGLLPIKDGIITVPDTPGIGAELDWELIQKACRSHKKLEL